MPRGLHDRLCHALLVFVCFLIVIIVVITQLKFSCYSVDIGALHKSVCTK